LGIGLILGSDQSGVPARLAFEAAAYHPEVAAGSGTGTWAKRMRGLAARIADPPAIGPFVGRIG
jgi:hypothetical protein